MKPYITTVVNPAATRDLVTLADVREQLSIRATDTANDVWLAKVISRASAQAEGFCNRIFVQQDYQDLFGSMSSDAGTPLMLGQAPVDVTLVTVDGTDLEATAFIADASPGLLYNTIAPRQWISSDSITVQYTGGFDPVPDDVQQAVIELCVMEFRSRGRDPMLRERETPGLGRETFWIGPMPGVVGSQLPGDIAALLSGYVRGLIG